MAVGSSARCQVSGVLLCLFELFCIHKLADANASGNKTGSLKKIKVNGPCGFSIVGSKSV